MKYHDNKLYFDNVSSAIKLRGGSYIINEFCITKGQDPDNKIYKGKKIKMDTEDFFLSFEVGRSDSPDVTKWFNDIINPDSVSFGIDWYTKCGGYGIGLLYSAELSLSLRDSEYLCNKLFIIQISG